MAADFWPREKAKKMPSELCFGVLLTVAFYYSEVRKKNFTHYSRVRSKLNSPIEQKEGQTLTNERPSGHLSWSEMTSIVSGVINCNFSVCEN